MANKKILYIPVKDLTPEQKEEYNIKESDMFAEVIVSNPHTKKPISGRGVKSAVGEVKKAFAAKGLEDFKI